MWTLLRALSWLLEILVSTAYKRYFRGPWYWLIDIGMIHSVAYSGTWWRTGYKRYFLANRQMVATYQYESYLLNKREKEINCPTGCWKYCFSCSEIQPSGKYFFKYREPRGWLWCGSVYSDVVCGVFNYLKTVVRSVPGVGTELFNISNWILRQTCSAPAYWLHWRVCIYLQPDSPTLLLTQEYWILLSSL